MHAVRYVTEKGSSPLPEQQGATELPIHPRVSLPRTLGLATIIVALAFLAMAASTTFAADVSWTSTASGNWSNSANWSTGAPPAYGDNVSITLPGTYTITLDVNSTLGSLTLGAATGTQTVSTTSARTLTINSPSAINTRGALTLNSSTLNGAGGLTNSGTLTISGASGTINTTLLNRGTIYLNSSCTFGGSFAQDLGATLRVHYNLTSPGFINQGLIELTNPAGFVSQLIPSGTLVNSPTGEIRASQGAGGNRLILGQVDNQGTITVNLGAGNEFSIDKASADHTNSGTINLNGGTLRIRQTGTTPSFTNASSGRINATGNVVIANVATGSVFTNFGTLALTSGRNILIQGGTFNEESGASLAGPGSTITLTSATMNLRHGFSTANGAMTLGTSTLNGPGVLTNPTGVILTLSNSSTVNASVNNAGTTAINGSHITGAFTQTPSGVLRVDAASSISGFDNPGLIELVSPSAGYHVTLSVSSALVNLPGGEIRASQGAGGDRSIYGQVDNQGTIAVSLGAGNQFSFDKASADHTNSGTINLNGGTLRIRQTGTSPSFTNASLGRINATGGSVIIANQIGDAIFVNSGALTLGSGRSLTCQGGTINEESGASIGGAGSSIAVSSATMNLSHDFNTANGTLTISVSTLNGPGAVTNAAGATLTLASGSVAPTIINTTVTNEGTVIATGGPAPVTINGAYGQTAGAILRVQAIANLPGFQNSGVIELISPSTGTNVMLYPATTLVNLPGGEIRALAGAGGSRFIYGQVDNQGAITVNLGASGECSFDKISADHTNSGTINLTGGALRIAQTGITPSFTNSGAITIDSGCTLISTAGTFTNAASGVIRGFGNLNVGTTFTNDGTMVPGSETTPGVLTVTGTYRQTAAGVLAVDLGGLTAGTQYDRLNVNGPVTLAGTIRATLTGAFVPVAGNTFTVMTQTARASTFDSFVNSTGGCLQALYDATTVILEACACLPPTIASSPVNTASCVGHSVTFAVVADGSGPLAYQWRKDGIPILGTHDSSLSFASISLGDAGIYDAVVTNECGQETSAAATLTVRPAGPDVTQHPADAACCIGSTATFSVAAEAHMGGALSYQWRKDGNPIVGATSVTLVVTAGSVADGGQYDCVVAELGCGTTTSHTAILTVKTDPPAITLAGVTEVVLECQDLYAESGATVEDDCDSGLAAVIGGDAVQDGVVGVYVVTYDAADSQGNPAAQVVRVVRVQDIALPTISLDGAPTMLVECHSEFADPGATAFDSCDPEPMVIVGGDQVDVNTPGTYVLTYRARDHSGNESPTVSRTVEVQDRIAPEITLVGDATMTVECQGAYEELGAMIHDACDPAATVTIGGEVVDATVPGAYIVTYSATDAAGNSATTSRTVEVVDTTPPILTVDTTSIVVTDVDCSGSEAVSLPLAIAEDLCDATPTVTHDAPARFSPGTTQVTFTARDDSGNETEATLDVTVKHGVQVEVQAARHTVGPGTRPSTTKAPLAGILVAAYERGPGSCIDQIAPDGVSWQYYPAIVASCTPVNTGLTDDTGVAVIDLPAGDYVIISHLATEDVYIADWANSLSCGETVTKRIQLTVANGTPRPGKTTRLTGSELLIIEPEYVIWDDSTQVYPFVFESIGGWDVSASVTPPDGFVSDYSRLSADVQSEIEAVQFTIVEEESELVPTRTTFQVSHGHRRHTVRSEVGLLLTSDYARSRGFDVAALEARGLIVDRDRSGGAHGRGTGTPATADARIAIDAEPKPLAPSTEAKASKPTRGVSSVSGELSLTAWPSPFSGSGDLYVAFRLPDGAVPPDLELGIFDVLGRRVAAIPSDLSVGRDGVAHVTWNGAEVRRGGIAPGVYFLRALAPSVGMRTECKLVVMR